jgi:hypothetical protein
LAHGFAVLDRVGNQKDWGHNERNHSPWTEQEIQPLKFPELFSYAGSSKIALQAARLPQNKHSDIAFKLHRRDLTVAPAKLALTDSIEVVNGCCRHDGLQ